MSVKQHIPNFLITLKNVESEKVWLCVSDAHIGLQEAIKKCWVGSGEAKMKDVKFIL